MKAVNLRAVAFFWLLILSKYTVQDSQTVVLLFGVRDECCARSLVATPQSSNFNVVDVTTFGAKGDGVTDDTEAFQTAWQETCQKESGTLYIPADYRFLVGPITFSGPCQSTIVFKVDGSITAPVSPGAWSSKLLQWINFSKLDGITIVGKGILDGQGAAWWNDESGDSGNSLPSVRPTALRFYGSNDVSVQDITIQNSAQCHLKFDSCTSVEVAGVNISSPEKSPNTDGIHLQNSQDVEIHHSSMACGDDCVSIQTGCSAVRIHNINCCPGHGISIGGLGKDGTKACVSNVSVYDSNIQDASSGVRIKTWQGGMGSVKSVSFSNIQVSNVRVPIDIDQFYCEKKPCPNRTSAVFITDITYEKITGTYSFKPLHLACSDDIPCTDLKLDNIQLQPAVPFANATEPSLCWNSYGQQLPPTDFDCLQSGRPLNDPSHSQSPADAC